MSNGFFRRLFAGDEIEWALHTTYTCDLDCLASLLAVRSPGNNGWSSENTAVFYDRKHPLRAKGRGMAGGVVLGELKGMTHPLENQKRQTFHAKLSLVCYKNSGEECGYRLAVYSKNMEFTGGCNDAALLFELGCGEQETESGQQLAAYLEKLRDSTDDAGKSWWEKHIGEDVLEQLKKSALYSEFGREAELFFGGCGDGRSLGNRLCLPLASNDSVVLTPPVFLEAAAGKPSAAETFFKNNLSGKTGPLLYDLASGKQGRSGSAVSSHIKLYLLKKPGGHELWTGSANSTVRGLGWPGANSYSNADGKASVECLVKFNLTAGEFKALKEGVSRAGYAPYPFTPQAEGSLKVKPDEFGPWMCENFAVNGLEYRDANDKACSPRDAKKLTVSLKSLSQGPLGPPKAGIWRPAEYSREDKITVSTSTLELTYPFDSFRPSQGMLVFGTSCSVMEIPGELLENIPTVKKAKDTRLSEWLLSADALEKAKSDSSLPNGLVLFRQLLLNAEGGGAAPGIGKQPAQLRESAARQPEAQPLPENCGGKAQPMQFQKNAAARMVDILETESRVFLADEAGLGKTYSAAAAVCKMAQRQWEEEGNNPTPFFCIYAAPNKALLNKCAEDFRAKGAELLGPDEKITVLESDRLVYHHKLLNNKKPSGKTIVLLRVSVGCLLDEQYADSELNCLKDVVGKDEFKRYYPSEWKKLDIDIVDEFFEGKQSESTLFLTKLTLTREIFTAYFLKTRQPQAIIWDEFHRYTTKLNGSNKVYKFIRAWEIISHNEPYRPLRSIFLSATPYRTNISGSENREALDRLYQLAEDEKEEKVDKLTDLPEFPAFAALFCDGWSRKGGPSRDELVKCHMAFVSDPGGEGTRGALKKLLQQRMIRHERTLLQGELEQHLRLYRPEELYAEQYGPALQNTVRQSRLLEKGGFSEGDRRWSLSMPWILSFFKKKDDNGGGQRLDPAEKTFVPELFVYDNEHKYIPERLRTLPQQNLPFCEMCRENLREEMAQLLWVPPAAPLYRPGEDSIFYKYRDYSKLLVFAEYHYYQKGGALLLSDYAALQNSTGEPAPDKLPALDFAGRWKLHAFDLTGTDRRECTLDELLEQRRAWLTAEYPGLSSDVRRVAALAMIAAPAVCAARLGLDPKAVEDAFNAYFNRDGVRQALWKWLCVHGCSDSERQVEGILRYCAEGNLYAVLEEWCFTAKKDTDTSLTAQLCELLNPREHFAQVTVSSFEDLKAVAAGQSPEGVRRECSFADRLTGDTGDVKSGDNDTVIAACANRFSSPFWPMVMFAGRGAQEGMDFHQYCLRIMHMTIPCGAVSFDQRNGRIDRYRSLLVRRRAAEWLGGIPCEGGSGNLLARMFYCLTEESGYGGLRSDPDDQLFPNWHIPAKDSRHHFEQLFPVWPFTEEYAALKICDAMLESYRRPFGSSPGKSEAVIDLSAPGEEQVRENKSFAGLF